MTSGAELQALLAVQDLDTAITQLTHRRQTLPERAELTSLAKAYAANDARAKELAAQRDQLTARQAALETQIESARSRRKVIEDRMYGARGTAARDLQAMDEESRHLGAHQTELEDAELELMEAAEPLDAELAQLHIDTADITAKAGELRSRLATVEAEVDAELVERQASRVEALAMVPADLLARYETLKQRLGGIGAARLVGSRCSGCHLELPSMEVERVHHLPAGTVATCEQCGRILVG